jgi:hypothetical protein
VFNQNPVVIVHAIPGKKYVIKPYQPKVVKTLNKEKKGTKEIYNTYISLHLYYQPKCESKCFVSIGKM